MHARNVALLVQPRRQLALGDGMIGAVRHVLFARPDQLDRRAGELLGDHHRLADIIVEGAAPAEAAAEMQLVDVALLLRQAGGFAAAASAASPFCVGHQTSQLSASSAPSRSSAPWWRGSDRDSRRSPRIFSPIWRLRRQRVAILIADDRPPWRQALLEEFGDRGAGDLGIRRRRPI